MDELLNNLKSLNWWVTVIIFGVIVSVIGAYTKVLIDRVLVKYSEKRRVKKEANFKKLIETAEKIPSTDFELIVLKIESTEHYSKWIYFNLVGYFIMIFSFFSTENELFGLSFTLLGFAIPIFYSAIYHLNKSYHKNDLFIYINNNRKN